ncbi:MAG: YfcE family phosphodiesterase [Gemmatimonadaceae bacterium]
MRVGVMSDTHDRIPAVAELLRQMAEAEVAMVLHAGDYCSPFVLKAFDDSRMTLAGIFGRNDGDPEGLNTRARAGLGIELFESPHSFDLGGQRVLIVHDIGDVQQRSLEAHAIVIHGSTHQQEMKTRGDTLILNPGEGCGWLHGTPQAAILDLDSKQVNFLSLDAAHWKY